MKKRLSVVLLLCIVSTGCATFQSWTKLEKQEYIDNARGFKASVPIGWMRHTQTSEFFITLDGELLNSIRVARVKFDTPLPDTKEKFLVEMNIQELSQVQINAGKSNPDITNFVVNSNKPRTVNGQQAFLLEYTFLNKDGLKYEGRNIGFSDGKWVYLLFYEAPSQYYFKKSLDVFESFVNSFELMK